MKPGPGNGAFSVFATYIGGRSRDENRADFSKRGDRCLGGTGLSSLLTQIDAVSSQQIAEPQTAAI